MKSHLRNYLLQTVLYLLVLIFLIVETDNPIYRVADVRLQLYVLLVLSYIMTISILMISNTLYNILVTMFNSLICFLIFRLDVNSLNIRILIPVVMYYLYFILFSHKLGFIISVMYCIIIGFTAKQNMVYGMSFQGLSCSEFLLFILMQVFIIIVLGYTGQLYGNVHVLIEKMKKKDEKINYLIDTNLGFQEYVLRVENESRLVERLNITREIHDIVGYTMTSISMMLEYGDDLLLEKKYIELEELLNTAREHARNGHEEVRMVLKKLRAIADTTLPFLNRIYRIVDNYKKVTLMDIELDLTNVRARNCREYENFILRFLQEGLTNANRHGKATKVTVVFFQTREELIISISDNGVGSGNITEGIGLKGMTERVREHGGFISYGSTDNGFRLHATLPINEL